MVTHLKEYLKMSKQLVMEVISHKLPEKHSLGVVMGNVAMDLDSTISSILLAYSKSFQHRAPEYLQTVEESKSPPRTNRYIFPIMNCKKEDLLTRLDIVYHLKEVGVEVSELIYAEEVLDILTGEYESNLDILLVDHNMLDVRQEKYMGYVKGIVDHHVWQFQGNEEQLSERFHELCGSTTSLVVNNYLTQLTPHLLTPQLAIFALAPILLDTSNFKPLFDGVKWTQTDVQAYSFLQQLFKDTHFDAPGYFRILKKERKNLEANLQLGLRGLMGKDYKNYKVQATIHPEKEIIFGISSLPIAKKHLLHFGEPNISLNFLQFTAEKELDLYLCLTSKQKKKRSLLVYSHNLQLLQQFIGDFVATNKQELSLRINSKKIKGFKENYTLLDYANLEFSRKKLEPLIRLSFLQILD